MDLSDIDYSDAGDSGWTMYLDHSSSVSLHHFDYHSGETKQELDEDSSMVSDASSGPPYYCEEAVPSKNLFQQNTQYWCKSKSKINSKNKNKKLHAEQGYSERFSSCLDDTASSLPVGEEVSEHKQHLEQHQRFDYFSQSYSTRKIFKDEYNYIPGYLQQAFPVNKLALANQGGSNQRKRRG